MPARETELALADSAIKTTYGVQSLPGVARPAVYSQRMR